MCGRGRHRLFPNGHVVEPLFGVAARNGFKNRSHSLRVGRSCPRSSVSVSRARKRICPPAFVKQMRGSRRPRCAHAAGWARRRIARRRRKIAQARRRRRRVDPPAWRRIIPPQRGNNADERERIGTDGDGPDAEALAISLAPFRELAGRLLEGDHGERHSRQRENNAAQFPIPEVCGNETPPLPRSARR